ncbi:MAG: 50S ribosomal protein L4 [Proteobacteria bacterium]|nr:50S ribosomal protein L4 [Pseudomonadota bacterium]
MKLAVKTLDNKAVGDVTIKDEVFGIEPRPDIMARVVNWQLAKRRAGTHKVKIRSEVAKTGAKFMRQKGTGRARRGSLTTNLFRGGGVAHGPSPRSYVHGLQKKVRRLGLKSALSVKARDGKLLVLDTLTSDGKTASLKAKLGKLGVTNALVIGSGDGDDMFMRAAGNIPSLDVLPQEGANVYDILRRDMLVVSREALTQLEGRLL